jgi:two-component system, OmpR family, phosphate regulon sensor histidine kinase PhoR
MSRQFHFNTTAVAIAIGLIAVSTVILSSFSYIHWAGKDYLVDEIIKQYTIKLATRSVSQIEQEIIANDNVISGMLNVDDPSSWAATAELLKKDPFNVDHVFVFRLDNPYALFPSYSREIANSWDKLRTSFKELSTTYLVPDQMNHLHKERADNYRFASYVLKANRHGDKFLVFFEMNPGKMRVLVERVLSDLRPAFNVNIVDFDNIGVAPDSQPISRNAKYYYEMRFPTTLYKWLLQVVPRNYTELERNARNTRRANLVLIVLSMTLIFCSLAIIYVAGRRERQLTQLKEEFISNVSHELKTPLSLIRMFSEILVSNRVKDDAARQEYYQIIHGESDRMSRLVANLLDFARLERERHGLHFEKINLGKLVAKELDGFRHQLQKDGFALDTRIDTGVPDTMADPNAISMAFFNLLDNAVKYSGARKHVTIRVRAGAGTVDLSVQDEGIGIPEDERHKIFEKFFRGLGAKTNRARGSGIGLSITRQVAEMHGGEIHVESEMGRGSTFTLSIPVRAES